MLVLSLHVLPKAGDTKLSDVLSLFHRAFLFHLVSISIQARAIFIIPLR